MKKWALLGITGVLVVPALFNIAFAAASTPGSENDPLVTLTYLNKEIKSLNDSISDTIKDLGTRVSKNESDISAVNKKIEDMGTQTGGSGSGDIFEVVNLPAGKKLIGENSTEIILRSGKVKIYSENKAGLSDITTGFDMVPGTYVQRNHLLIVPRTDGRGVTAQATAVVMVKGKYTIE